MKKLWLGFLMIGLLLSCSSEDGLLGEKSDYTSDDLSLGSGSSDGGTQTGGGQAGVITAGEWNDLDNWMFLDSLISSQDYAKMLDYWGFYTNHRISVKLVDASSNPILDQEILLKRNGTTIWTARSDNRGMAELWVDLYQHNADIDFTTLQLVVGSVVSTEVKTYSAGVNTIVVSGNTSVSNKVELAFVVDATGSMSDELEFLKTELLDVINRAKSGNPSESKLPGTVFYRDEGDDYVTRVSAFNSDIQTTLNFIKDQSANGGGDFPEAVHTALDKALNNLQWSSNARTRILFLVLDAPPHYDPAVIAKLQSEIKLASEKGIKIIPITASGIDKETEFLMRFMAATTNGTYVFITNDSGVGGEHLQPTIGKYDVEKLNDLMVRLINKYIKIQLNS